MRRFDGTLVYMSSTLLVFHRTAVIRAHHCAGPERLRERKKIKKVLNHIYVVLWQDF